MKRASLPFALLLAVVLVAALAPSAQAAFPGRNGRIVYSKGVSYRSTEGVDWYGDAALVTRDPDGRHQKTLLRCSNDPMVAVDCRASLGDPASSRTGARLAWACLFPGESARICTVRADGSGLRALPGLAAPPPQEPAWSPSGRLIFAGVDSARGLSALYVVRADGSGLRRLTHSAAQDAQPAWSLRGRIAFARRIHFRRPDIYTLRADGHGLRRLTFRGGSEPAWSPRGSKLAFVRNDDVYIVRASGRGLRRLTRSPFPWKSESPVWSPDGKRIAFVRETLPDLANDPDRRIYTIRTDRRRRRLVDQVSGCGGAISLQHCGLDNPDWQPLPRRRHR